MNPLDEALSRVGDALEAPRLLNGETVVTITSEDASRLLDVCVRANAAEEALVAMKGEREIMAKALTLARDTFIKYEALHRAKGTSEANFKADANGILAAEMQGALCGTEVSESDRTRAEAAEASNARMREALEAVTPPSHGVCGGPCVGARVIYEDGTDENTARHKGWISHEAYNRARAALSPKEGEGSSERQRPTIEELEAILAAPGEPQVVILPNGEIRAVSPDEPLPSSTNTPCKSEEGE